MFAVIFIPDFFLQAALRHEPEMHSRPAALTDPDLPKAGIIQCNPHARTAAVEEGISASQALARCPALLIKSRSLPQEQAAGDLLIQTAYAFSPFIEATGPGICTMDLRGLRIVSNGTGVKAWAEEIRAALTQFHLDSRIGFAPTPDLALLAASCVHRSAVNCVGDSTQFLADLPTQMLGLSAEMLETLNRWGIKTAAALAQLGKDPLAERLGPEVIAIFERLSPDFIRPLKITAMPEMFCEQMEFQTEIETLEPLLFVLRRFTEQLVHRIQMLYLVVAELNLKLGLTSGANYESALKVPSPTGNAETLFRMLHTHLENVRTDAAISSLCLAAKPVPPDTHQFGLFETTLRNPNQFAETLARLEALCGPDRVGTPVLEPTLRPDAFKLKPANFSGKHEKDTATSPLTSALPPPTGGACRAATSRAFESPAPGRSAPLRPDSLQREESHLLRSTESEARTKLSPLQSSNLRSRSPLDTCPLPISHGLRLRRFRPPLSAHVDFHQRSPTSIRSFVCNGKIVDRRGPFFASGNWWDEGRWLREEWDVQMADGTMYRIFRAKNCFVEGVYD